MKKTSKTCRKLALETSTLKLLSSAQLSVAQGGSPGSIMMCTLKCTSDYCVPPGAA